MPVDVIIADKFDADAFTDEVSVERIPDGWMGLDHGPETCKLFRDALADCKTIVWNGPMGAFEMAQVHFILNQTFLSKLKMKQILQFSTGTYDLAEYLAELTEEKGAITIVGGGDSVAAVKKR